MKDHWTSLTYAPKILGVRGGTITQTIRSGRKYLVGDRIAFHGWQDRPYRSPWSFRTPMFLIETAANIIIFPWGIQNDLPGMEFELYTWDQCDLLAEKDGIVPATGEELDRILCSLNKITDSGITGQIVRWRGIPE